MSEDRDRYAAKKRELAQKSWRFIQNYADAKSEIVREILMRARQGTANGAAEARSQK